MALDRLKEAFAAIVRGMVPQVDYFAWYRARVVQQQLLASGASLVDVQPDDPRIPGMKGIPLRLGMPAVSVQIAPGGFVLVGWDGGDPGKPQAALWDGGEAPATKAVINALALFLGGEVGAEATIRGLTYRAAEATANNALVAAFTGLAAACVGPLAPLAAGFTAAATAVQAFESGSTTYLSTKAKVV